jgi:hypothetical protein
MKNEDKEARLKPGTTEKQREKTNPERFLAFARNDGLVEEYSRCRDVHRNGDFVELITK